MEASVGQLDVSYNEDYKVSGSSAFFSQIWSNTMDEELFLENNLFPWLDDPSYDEAGEYNDYDPWQDESLYDDEDF
jgi:hypothetical protein